MLVLVKEMLYISVFLLNLPKVSDGRSLHMVVYDADYTVRVEGQKIQTIRS